MRNQCNAERMTAGLFHRGWQVEGAALGLSCLVGWTTFRVLLCVLVFIVFMVMGGMGFLIEVGWASARGEVSERDEKTGSGIPTAVAVNLVAPYRLCQHLMPIEAVHRHCRFQKGRGTFSFCWQSWWLMKFEDVGKLSAMDNDWVQRSRFGFCEMFVFDIASSN